MKLSNTQIDSYRACGMKYKFYYIDRLREDALNSPLIFGATLDETINFLLKNQTASLEDLFILFDKNFSMTSLNGEAVSIPLCEKIKYSKSDYDSRLLNEEDYKQINNKFDSIVEIGPINIDKFISEMRGILKEGTSLKDEHKLFNYIHWRCLRRKAQLMIAAYKEEIIPNIERIHAIQKPIELTNADGDSLIGYIDFIADWKGNGRVNFDNKTSSRKYGPDSVKESQQLTIYSEAEQHYQSGYIVMLKDLKWETHKKCAACGQESLRKFKTCDKCGGEWLLSYVPKVNIQVIIDEIQPDHQEKIFEMIEDVTVGIKNKKFLKNTNSCYLFGRQCEYYDYCKKGIKGDLVQLPDRRKKER